MGGPVSSCGELLRGLVPASSAAGPAADVFLQGRGVVVLFLAGGEDEGKGPFLGEGDEVGDPILSRPEFGEVSSLELGPSIGVVGVPLSERTARSHVWDPCMQSKAASR